MKNLGPDLGFKDIKKLCREEKDLMNLNIKSLATSFSDQTTYIHMHCINNADFFLKGLPKIYSSKVFQIALV